MRLEPNLAITVRRLNTEEPSCPHTLISRMGLVLLHRDFIEAVIGGCSGT